MRVSPLLAAVSAFALVTPAAAFAGDKDKAANDWTRAKNPDQQTSLGASVRQIDDADLIGDDGRELGDVEYVLIGPDGEPGAVVVELDDDRFGENRYVKLELAKLTLREDVDSDLDDWDDKTEYNVVTAMTSDELRAMEAFKLKG